jgi:uncharacterized protein YggE
MKKTIQTLVVVSVLTLSTSAFSQSFGDTVTGISVSTVGLTAAVLDAATRTVMSPFVLTSATTMAAARVELEAVQADANDYLEGADKTDMLDEVIQKIRYNSEEDISQASDVQISIAILSVNL